MSDNSRRQGVDLGELEDDLEAHEYPASTKDLVQEYGDELVELENGTRRFSVILAPYLHDHGDDEGEMFESAEAVQNATMNLVGSDAVGREHYSDRGDEREGRDREDESI